MNSYLLRLISLLVGCFIIPFSLLAAFVPGTVVTSQSDTLSGWIEAGNAYKLLTTCRFKTTKKGRTTHYKANEIVCFDLTNSNRHFIQATVPYYNKNRVVFLEQVVSGQVNLFIGYDNVLKEMLYLSKRDSSLVDIIFKWEGTTLLGKTNHHQLVLSFLDAPDMRQDIFMMDYPSAETMTPLVKKYNKLVENEPVTTSEPPSSLPNASSKEWRFVVSPGMLMPQLSNITNQYRSLFGGMSLSVLNSNQPWGFFFSGGIYVPCFDVYVYNHGLMMRKTSIASEYSYYCLIPLCFEYRFNTSIVQPLVGLDVTSYLKSFDPYALAGPYAGIKFHLSRRFSLTTCVKWHAFMISTQIERTLSEKPVAALIEINVTL